MINLILSIQSDYNKKEIYRNEECRLSLYQNLFQLCLIKNLKIIPPLSISTSLFTGANVDHSLNVNLILFHKILIVFFSS